MKNHLPLPIPSDSAWSRPSWRKYAPIWLKKIVDGTSNIIKWAPTIYKNRDWDDSFIFEMLKFKLIQQRKEIVGANRHMGVEVINRDITICLNLIERIQEETYNLEYLDYVREKVWFSDNENGTSTYNSAVEWENFAGYFLKYQNQTKRLVDKDPGLALNKMSLALRLSDLNQQRCQALLFKILNEKINTWWD
jgi:hypothetical protein